MIITCPNCDSEYDILETALGEAGRDVKCAKCTHVWFAAPEGVAAPAEPSEEDIADHVEEVVEAVEEKIEENANQTEPEETESKEEIPEEDVDIPESVKPALDEAFEEDAVPPQSLQAKMAGFGAALLIFGFLIVFIFMNKNQIIGAWPPSALFYDMAGVPAKLKGEGLVIESLSATVLKNREQQDVLVVKGRVVNLTGQAIDVPKMQAGMRTTNGEDVERWIIDPPVETISAGESFAFTSDYPNVSQGIGSVNLAFIPTLK